MPQRPDYLLRIAAAVFFLGMALMVVAVVMAMYASLEVAPESLVLPLPPPPWRVMIPSAVGMILFLLGFVGFMGVGMGAITLEDIKVWQRRLVKFFH